MKSSFSTTGSGPPLQLLDIGHAEYSGLIDPDSAFWALVRTEKIAEALNDGTLLASYRRKRPEFAAEMQQLRFAIGPSAVYLNPTERCNLNCTYCYLPEEMRRWGQHMSPERLFEALERLKQYFRKTVPDDRRPQVIFHGAEPLLNREAVFAGIQRFAADFHFGVQTNATLLDDHAVEFLTQQGVSIGISLDGAVPRVADRARKNWSGKGVYRQVVAAMEHLEGYGAWSVICTVTQANMRQLPELVEFLHDHHVPTCLLNVVRCTLPAARPLKPADADAARYYLAALERTHELLMQTGRKLVVANFANVLLAILAPTARRLMCDIAPCGGGRRFFAVAATGDVFPCSEFIGLPAFRGGNLFENDLAEILASRPFHNVTSRKIEQIEPCSKCPIRHFCGAPCPAEAYTLNGGTDQIGAFCEFYREQARYAFRLIADGRESAFLWDDWDAGMTTTFDLGTESDGTYPQS